RRGQPQPRRALRVALFAVAAAVLGVALARIPTANPLADVLHAGEKVIAAQPPPTAPAATTTTATTEAPPPSTAAPVAPRPVRVRTASAPAPAAADDNYHHTAAAADDGATGDDHLDDRCGLGALGESSGRTMTS